MSQDIDILKRALAREKASRKSAEKILEEKSKELYHLSQKLKNLLEEKSAQLQGVFENIIDAYVIIDLQGDVLKFNDAATELFGYDIDIESLNVVNLVHKEDYRYAVNSFMELKKNNYFKNYEARIYTKLKEIKWVHINASMVLDRGIPIAAQGVVRDITDIKNLEVQKKGLLQKLETSNDMLQEYAHVVSHDLKSPLRSIDALVNWIKEDNRGKLDATSLNNLDLIETTLGKMELLITDVLNYSSIDARNTEMLDVDLNELIVDIFKMLYIPNHIEIKLSESLPVVRGDKTKLQQLFQNLISNAIKFNDKKSGVIEIDVEPLNDSYQFAIKDNGIGIEEKYYEKIFEIFHSLKKRRDSTGIGLSIVKKIVELHGGKIWLESDFGKGAIFYFTLQR